MANNKSNHSLFVCVFIDLLRTEMEIINYISVSPDKDRFFVGTTTGYKIFSTTTQEKLSSHSKIKTQTNKMTQQTSQLAFFSFFFF